MKVILLFKLIQFNKFLEFQSTSAASPSTVYFWPFNERKFTWWFILMLNQLSIISMSIILYSLLTWFDQAHIEVCSFDGLSQCPNDCSARLPRAELDSHVKYLCPRRRVTCSSCIKEFVGDAIDVSSHTVGWSVYVFLNWPIRSARHTLWPRPEISWCLQCVSNSQYCGS